MDVELLGEGAALLHAIIATTFAVRVQQNPRADLQELGRLVVQHIDALAELSGYQATSLHDLAQKWVNKMIDKVSGLLEKHQERIDQVFGDAQTPAPGSRPTKRPAVRAAGGTRPPAAAGAQRNGESSAAAAARPPPQTAAAAAREQPGYRRITGVRTTDMVAAVPPGPPAATAKEAAARRQQAADANKGWVESILKNRKYTGAAAVAAQAVAEGRAAGRRVQFELPSDDSCDPDAALDRACKGITPGHHASSLDPGVAQQHATSDVVPDAAAAAGEPSDKGPAAAGQIPVSGRLQPWEMLSSMSRSSGSRVYSCRRRAHTSACCKECSKH